MQLVLSGAADGTIKVWDARQLGSGKPPPLHTFAVHTEAVMRVEWSPHHAGGLVRSQTPCNMGGQYTKNS